MNIYLFSILINLPLIILFLAFLLLVIIGLIWLAGRVARQLAADYIQLRGLWLAQGNGQVLADLQQQSLAVDLRHRIEILEVEAAKARLPIQRERLGILSVTEEAQR